MIYSKTQYYEAKFQIRPNNKKLIDFFKNQVDKDKNCFIIKEITNKYGTDFFLTSRKSSIIIVKKLKKNFNGTVKVTKTLYGIDKQKSKKIYRLTVLFRLHE